MQRIDQPSMGSANRNSRAAEGPPPSPHSASSVAVSQQRTGPAEAPSFAALAGMGPGGDGRRQSVGAGASLLAGDVLGMVGEEAGSYQERQGAASRPPSGSYFNSDHQSQWWKVTATRVSAAGVKQQDHTNVAESSMISSLAPFFPSMLLRAWGVLGARLEAPGRTLVCAHCR